MGTVRANLIMRKLFFTLSIICCTILLQAQQSEYLQFNSVNHNSDTNVVYKLFPTNNVYTFIRLNTKTGSLSQVHFNINEKDGAETVVDIGKPYFIKGDDSEMRAGRFDLYPTRNMWTFILLDQYYGDTWHVQWSWDKDKRFVTRIY